MTKVEEVETGGIRKNKKGTAGNYLRWTPELETRERDEGDREKRVE